jgi:plastocyanin
MTHRTSRTSRTTRAALALTAVAVALPGGAVAVAAGKTKGVSVKDDKFVAKSITVSAGTTVKWTWKGRAPHNVTVVKGPRKFHSDIKTKGTFSRKLSKRGTYRLLCTIHAPDMKMTIKVK